MNLFEAAVILMVCGMLVASGSIGLQYFSMCPQVRNDDQMKQNRNFLIAAVAIGCIAAASVFVHKDFRRDVGRLVKNFV